MPSKGIIISTATNRKHFFFQENPITKVEQI